MNRWLRTLVLMGLVACWSDRPAGRGGKGAKGAKRGGKAPVTATAHPDLPTAAVPPEDPRPALVLLVVLDTVRADHTGLCGDTRPITPNLDGLAARASATSCHAYSPAPWTHPSHASMFTGKPVTEHGAIWVSDSAVAINPVTKVRPLDASYETLAEAFAAQGYQTVAITANPIVTADSGLLQGFEHVRVAKSVAGFRGPKFAGPFFEVLGQLDPTRPVFLFLNFYDAHDPYPATPAGLDWLTAQERLDLEPNKHDEALPYYRYVRGLSSEAEAEAFLAQIRTGYAGGVWMADQGLGGALRALDKAGWLADARVAVTADHGELLGEHHLLRHGGYLWEPVVNVPLVWLDTSADAVRALPDPVSTVAVHDLLLTGKLPADAPVVAVSEKNDTGVLMGQVGAAVWSADRNKLTCVEGKRARYDLSVDPGELTPAEVGDHAAGPALDAACAGLEAVLARPVPVGDGQREALRKAGYVE